MSTPRPSSTVMLIRDHNEQIEVLLVQRSKELKTNAGAWVFPGGNVDEEDYASISNINNREKTEDDNFIAAQYAAVREADEETGITIELGDLTPFAHWTTPKVIPRRYSTWFFLAYYNDKQDVTVDGSEIVGYRWATPDRILNLHRSGEIAMIPPTFVSLQKILPFSSCKDAFTALEKTQPFHYNPRMAIDKTADESNTPKGENIFTGKGIRTMLYEGDAGYETQNYHAEGPRHRLVMNGTEWHYESNF
ncbi:MAG: NUDIX hydrolase [Cellvibrionaceae bacterium]